MDDIYVGSDNMVTHVLTDSTGEPVSGATIEVTLHDADGTEVSGQAWPLVLAETATAGTYAGTLQDTLNLDRGKVYTRITTVSGAGLQGRWETRLRAVVQEG